MNVERVRIALYGTRKIHICGCMRLGSAFSDGLKECRHAPSPFEYSRNLATAKPVVLCYGTEMGEVQPERDLAKAVASQ